jgi:hypothetical protein
MGLTLAGIIGGLGAVALIIAVANERRMQRHRQPGVTYAQVTLRRDGAWKRRDLFTDEGLAYQRRASAFGVTGAALLVAALVCWVVLG